MVSNSSQPFQGHHKLCPKSLTISPSWVYKLANAYQTHLERIANFLVSGDWHRITPNGVEFLNGPEELHYRPNGPFLSHFQSSSIFAEAKKQKETWQDLIEKASKGDIMLPYPNIKVYDQNGDKVGELTKEIGPWNDPEEIDNEEVPAVEISNGRTET